MSKFFTILIAAYTLFFAAGLGVANSQGRPDSRRMTCDQAYNFVQRHGAVVMTTGRYTFERVVADRRWCQLRQVLERYTVPTRDEQRCRVGYKCVERYLDFR